MDELEEVVVTGHRVKRGLSPELVIPLAWLALGLLLILNLRK